MHATIDPDEFHRERAELRAVPLLALARRKAVRDHDRAAIDSARQYAFPSRHAAKLRRSEP